MMKSKIVVYLMVLSFSVTTRGIGQTLNFEERALSRIEAGTLAVDGGVGDWNRLLLLANTRLTQGDTTALSQSIRDSVSGFRLTLMAKVHQGTALPGSNAPFQLQAVGVNYASLIRDKFTIVDVANASKLGLELNFVSRQFLSENEKQLVNVSFVAMSPAVAIFDAPSLMHRKQKHVDLVTRHFLWLDAASGRLTMLIWLLEKIAPQGPLRVFDEPMRLVAAPVYEERVVHIDGNEFFLGIPSKQAFALADLPPGKSIAWTDDIKDLAALEKFDEASLKNLVQGLNLALRGLRKNRVDQ